MGVFGWVYPREKSIREIHSRVDNRLGVAVEIHRKPVDSRVLAVDNSVDNSPRCG